MATTADKLVMTVNPAAKGKAQRLASKIGRAVTVVSTEETLPERRRSRPTCVLYLEGTESLQNIRKSLQKVAETDKDVVLYVGARPTPETIFQWGALCERLLPGRSRGIVFSSEELQSLLAQKEIHPQGDENLDPSRLTVEALRRTLGLTQAQMAKVAGVTTRTIQNWERDKESLSVSRSFSDLAELREMLLDHVIDEEMPKWLNSPNETLGHKKPVQLLEEGHTRDLLWQLRSAATGEPV